MDQQAAPIRGAGPAASLRTLAATLVEIIGTRAQLAVVELRQETERRRAILVLAGVAAFFLALAIVLATLFVVVVFWDTHRLAAIGGAALVDLAIAGTAFWTLQVKVATSPPPFEATLREFAADRDLLGAQRPGERADDE